MKYEESKRSQFLNQKNLIENETKNALTSIREAGLNKKAVSPILPLVLIE